ncbi:ABC transporter permease [Aurantimonas sp. A3-2-R12]|uniref:ABC transporter permease n=1 Tax=Aurantimonas sp. A3-2-R12 TaxID=3114362 RepID=UPI002E1947C6|nr:ABC transporter permease subunit [Aurantimonas sp. A3-2-R12]
MASMAQDVLPDLRRRPNRLPLLRLALVAGASTAILAAGQTGRLAAAPAEAVVPLADWLSAFLTWFSDTFQALFRALSLLLAWPIEQIRAMLQWLPWPTLVLTAAAIGQMAGGRRLAAFCALTFLYIIAIGLWEPTAVTLALIAVAVPLSALLALLLGIAAFLWPPIWRLLQPLLDLMQTIPTLAYLLPILALFGIGPMIAVVASAIYAIPPMVRAVVHGLQRIPPEIVESGLMSGSNRRQLLAWVLVPSAMPTILLGLNQTIMAGLSMVVIASMVGGVSDIGIEVYQAMKQAKFGRSILAGLVIALLAMTMDRVSRGFAGRSGDGEPVALATRGAALVLLAAAGASLAAAWAVPALRTYPEAWVLRPAPLLDAALDWFTVVSFPVTSALKTYTAYFVLLPLKIGLPQAVRPNVWGFEMSAAVTYGYVAVLAACSLGLLLARHWAPALGLGVLGIYYYFGTTGTPWLFTIALLTAAGCWVGGWRVGLVALLGMLFILLTGSWDRAMVSLELTAVGVAVSVLAGTAIGVWAALNDRVSAVVRPICDTLQTMPIFVFLIPAVMVFLVGEFTALVAIVLYAIVPPIRYGELGIRGVPPELTEAARMMGVTRLQMLWQVQLPVALPEIALGVNQTVMMALTMVVIASLVGAPGLGQDVLIALSRGDAGRGLVAGLSIAALAIVFDRIVQAWSAERKRALGLQ